MKHILLPTDFSDTAHKAATFAMSLFGTEAAHYTLLNAYLKQAYRSPLIGLQVDTERASHLGLRREERRLRRQMGKVRIALRSNSRPLAQAIAEVHAERPVALVVMGPQGEGNYGLVGRNTTAAVTSTALPLIAVPAQWKPVKLDQILFADDGLEDTEASLLPMLEIARTTGARSTLLHVDAGADNDGQRARLKAMLKGIPHKFSTMEGGDVARTLEHLTQEDGVDLMAVVRRQRNFWERLFQGSTSKRLAMHTTVPLLVMRG